MHALCHAAPALFRLEEPDRVLDRSTAHTSLSCSRQFSSSWKGNSRDLHHSHIDTFTGFLACITPLRPRLFTALVTYVCATHHTVTGSKIQRFTVLQPVTHDDNSTKRYYKRGRTTVAFNAFQITTLLRSPCRSRLKRQIIRKQCHAHSATF